MKEIIQLNKCRGLWGKLIFRLNEINRPDSFILWSNVYEKLCRGFSLSKQDIRESLLVLRDLGLIEISPKGLKLNYRVKNG